MPKHDLPDGRETEGNLIDIRDYLRRRVDLPAQDNDSSEPATPDWDVYRYAENGDGQRPRLNRYDALWLGLLAAIGLLLWALIRR